MARARTAGRPVARLRLPFDRRLSVSHRSALRRRQFRAQGHAHAAAQASARCGRRSGYDPKLVIGEFTGPLEISEPGGPRASTVNWTSAQASVRGLPAGVERASLALVEPTVRDPSIAANDAVFRAQRLELHGRPLAGSTVDNPLVETALRLGAAAAEKLPPPAAQPLLPH